MSNCEHIRLDVISKPFIKGFSDFVIVECITCFESFEIEYKEDN